MLQIEKLSEKVLLIVLNGAYPGAIIHQQKRIKVLDKVMIVDYEVIYNNKITYFEFDGPTHYTNSTTQARDLLLAEYCDIEGILLVRIPYFIQINANTYNKLLPYSTQQGSITSEYYSGFHDTKITYPGNFNSYGWELFLNQFYSFDSITQQEVYSSLIEGKVVEYTIGIDYTTYPSKVAFLNSAIK